MYKLCFLLKFWNEYDGDKPKSNANLMQELVTCSVNNGQK